MTIKASLAAVLVGAAMVVSPAHATSDSWVRVRYPLADLQVDDANCEASIIVLDAISGGPGQLGQLLTRVLSAPIEAANPLGGSGRPDTNAITYAASPDHAPAVNSALLAVA